jgi:hypothetical protein
VKFAIPPTPEQQEWLLKQSMVPCEPNPCVRAFGKGPEGAICKQCKHLFRKRISKTYIKCDLRTYTNGPGSDHKARWHACSKFEQA